MNIYSIQQNIKILNSKIHLNEFILAVVMIFLGILWLVIFIRWLIKKKKKTGNQ